MSDALRLHGLLGDKKPTGNAVAGDVRAGKTFSNANGTDVAGTLAVRTGDNTALATSTAGTTFKLRPPAGIYDGVTDMVTHTDANRIASNIRQGITLDGVVGNLEPRKFALGTLSAGSGSKIVSGLSFKPTLVYIYTTNGGSSTAPFDIQFLTDWDSYPYYYYYSGWGKSAGIKISGNNSLNYNTINANQITADGFTASISQSVTCSWFAFG